MTDEQQLDEAMRALTYLGSRDPVVELAEALLNMGIMPDDIKLLASDLIPGLAVPANVLRGEHHADLCYSTAAHQLDAMLGRSVHRKGEPYT